MSEQIPNLVANAIVMVMSCILFLGALSGTGSEQRSKVAFALLGTLLAFVCGVGLAVFDKRDALDAVLLRTFVPGGILIPASYGVVMGLLIEKVLNFACQRRPADGQVPDIVAAESSVPHPTIRSVIWWVEVAVLLAMVGYLAFA